MPTQSSSATAKSKWKSLGQLLGALGVIISLGFVAWEIRQNTEAVKSATIQAISEQSFTSISLIIQDNDLNTIIRLLREDKALSKEQQFTLHMFYEALIRIQLNRYLQISLGILDPETALIMGGRARIYQSDEFDEFWASARDFHTEGFAQYMETQVMRLNSIAD